MNLANIICECLFLATVFAVLISIFIFIFIFCFFHYNFSLFTLPRICDFGIFKPLIFNRFLYLGNMLDFLVCYDMALGANLKCPSFANAFF